jgi:hypothetical protein
MSAVNVCIEMRHRRAAAAAAVMLVIAGVGGCHSASPSKGKPVTKDQMRAEMVSTTRSLIRQTGIELNAAVTLSYESCTDNIQGPYSASITSSFRGKPTLAESETQVDSWVAVMQRNGWSTPKRVADDATRYVPRPGGFTAELVPHLDPELQRGADFVVRGPCGLTGDLEYETEDVAAEIN